MHFFGCQCRSLLLAGRQFVYAQLVERACAATDYPQDTHVGHLGGWRERGTARLVETLQQIQACERVLGNGGRDYAGLRRRLLPDTKFQSCILWLQRHR